ncbi:xeroderma pigmentosum group C-complementing protein, partial [Tremellales sp. Uapishka_1]
MASRPKIGRIVVRSKTGGRDGGPSTPVSAPKKNGGAPPTKATAAAAGSKRRMDEDLVKKVLTSTEKGKGKSRAALPTTPRSDAISVHSSASSDEDDDFEEVPVPDLRTSMSAPGTPTTPGSVLNATTPGTMTTAPSIDNDYEGYGEGGSEEEAEEDGVIRLEFGGETAEEKAKRIALAMRKKPMTSKDRALRLEAHKMHAIALLASARIRNRWCCHPLLKARLLSLLPHPLHAAFSIPPSRFPDRAKRSRMFFDALQNLVTWWSETFFDISDPTLGIRTRPWDEVQEVVDTLPRLTRSDFAPRFGGYDKGKEKEEEDYVEKVAEGAGGERLRSVNSLMKKVLQQEGSRDVSAQLFVAMARACGLGARLVVSLQAVPWRAEKVVVKKVRTGAGKGGRTVASRQGVGEQDQDSDEESMEEVPIPEVGEKEKIQARRGMRGAGPRRLQDPADLYRLRPTKPALQTVGKSTKPKKKQDLSQQPPVFWAEVFSRSDQRWIPVDPVRGVIRKKSGFEPASDSGPIRMLYVVAFEEDGYARDVTLRYARNFGAKTVKLRVPIKKDEPDWWGEIMGFLQRPYRLNRDDLEDAELETSQVSEGMPMHMSGFKDHPIYVLERHLKREEVIQPKREVGRFKGEPVYRRANVLSCKTSENWMRMGRRVKAKEEPMKWVKQRAVTLNKRRAQELAIQEGQEPMQQGLYSETQTEIYRPPPIVDGKIPQNSFGNIDLYVPTMLPAGAIHLPYKGIAKIAKGLGISYAEACTGFDFKKQRAIPVITGIVVAQDQEEPVLEAYWVSAAAAEEKALVKKEEAAVKRWVKLINGLRVKARLQAEYGTAQGLHEQQHNPLADPASAPTVAKAANIIASANKENTDKWVNKIRERSPSPMVVNKTPSPGPVSDDPKTSPYFDGRKNPPVTVVDFADASEIDESVRSVQVGTKRSSADESDVDESVESVQEIPQRPKRQTRKAAPSSRPSRKRKSKPVQDEDEEGGEEDEDEKEGVPPPRKIRLTVKSSKAVPTSTSTRSLRSRAPKTAEQEKEERRRRERVMEALESDPEEE